MLNLAAWAVTAQHEPAARSLSISPKLCCAVRRAAPSSVLHDRAVLQQGTWARAPAKGMEGRRGELCCAGCSCGGCGHCPARTNGSSETWQGREPRVLERGFSLLRHLMGRPIYFLFPGLIVSLEKELTPLFEELRQVVEVS